MKFKIIFFVLLLVCQLLYAGVDFDATDDRITFGTTNLPKVTGGMSLYAVFDLASITGDQAIIGSWGASNEMWLMFYDDSAPDIFLCDRKESSAGGDTHNYVSSSITPAINIVYRVACAMPVDLGTRNININGTASSGSTFWFNGAAGTTLSPWMGATADTPANFFGGNLYHACVWSSELSTAQLDMLTSSRQKNICSQISPSTLQAEFYLDDQPDGTSGDADTFKDHSTNANNGTGVDGANNTGLTMIAEKVSSYP